MTPPRIHGSAVVDQPCRIGEGTSIWHFAHVREESQIGPLCNIGQGVYVGRGVIIGAAVKVQNNVSVYEGVTLEDEVFVGPSAVFTNVINPRAAIERKHEFLPTLVKRGATIGANATVLCGVTIGRWALIGAGALVREDVPDFALVVGVPARRVGWVTMNGDTIPQLVVGQVWQCPRDGSRYLLAKARQLELVSPEPPVRSV